MVTASDVGNPSFRQAYYLIDDIGLYQSKTVPPPEPAPEAPSLEDMEVKVGQVIQLDNIYFATAKWDLLPASFAELDQLVSLMKKQPGMKIAIHGHTDDRGSDPYNQYLSENRARAVYTYLLDHQVEKQRIEFEGFGEAKPIASNETVRGRQMNRRVEFVVLELHDLDNVATDGQ
ncbi:MAG: OmpA family protein, partial [Bacteroidota bacterium]